MRLPRRISEPGFVVSALIHAGALAATLVAFSHEEKFDDTQQETVPVEMVTDTQFNQIMRGEKSAKDVRPEAIAKAEQVSQVTETKPNPPTPDQSKDVPTPPPPPPPPPVPPSRAELPPDPTPPLPPPPPTPPVPTPPVRPEPPKPEAKQPPVPTPPVRDVEAEPIAPKPEPKPVPKPEPKPAPKPVPVPPEPPKVVHDTHPTPKPPRPERPKLDQLAKLIQDQPTSTATPTRTSSSHSHTSQQTSEESKFDPTDISRLLSHEAPAQRPSTGHDVSRVASLGSPTANAAKMSPSLWGALDGLLEDQYRQCWSYLGLASGQKYIPQVRVVYSQTGGLEGEPVLINPPSDPAMQSLADSALRAVRRCNPLKIPEQFAPFYDQWKGRVLRFDPEEMAG